MKKCISKAHGIVMRPANTLPWLRVRKFLKTMISIELINRYLQGSVALSGDHFIVHHRKVPCCSVCVKWCSYGKGCVTKLMSEGEEIVGFSNVVMGMICLGNCLKYLFRVKTTDLLKTY
jgi:hypothetical protein